MRLPPVGSVTVACVWVRGHVAYSLEYVLNLRAMVRKFLAREFRFVCLTDRPRLLRGVETITVPSPGQMYGWWSKIRLFDPSLGLTGRVLFLDLDTLVVGRLDAVVDYPAAFALAPHSGDFQGKRGLRVVKRFNSSVMVWDHGVNGALFEAWDASVPKRLWGDQDWIGEQCSQASVLPAAWVPRLSQVGAPPFPQDTKIVLAKSPKNHVAARQWPWFNDLWRGAA